jgi:hypothetical protein
MISDIYKIIKQKLRQDVGLEAAWYTGQYEQTGEQVLFEQAACFVEFSPISFIQRGMDAQQATLEFTVHVVHESLGGDDARILDIEHLEKVDACFIALQGFSATVQDVPGYTGMFNDTVLINRIERTTLTMDHRMSNLLVTLIQFRTIIWDYKAMPIAATVSPQLQIITSTR